MKGKRAEISTESGARIVVSDLSIFFDIVASSLLNSESGYITEVISGGDIRRGLMLVRDFLASGHTSADKALNSYLSKGTFQFPRHEIFKGFLLGQRKFYREEESLVINIFDSKIGSQSLQLLRLRILSRIVLAATIAGQEGPSLSSIEEDLHCLGIPPDDIREIISQLLGNFLICCDTGLELLPHSRLYPTRWGGFLARELCSQFMYIEPCSLDTAIYDDNTWAELEELTSTFDATPGRREKIKIRLKRAQIFVQYLQRNEQVWLVECKRRSLSNHWDTELIEDIRVRFEREGEQIVEKLRGSHA